MKYFKLMVLFLIIGGWNCSLQKGFIPRFIPNPEEVITFNLTIQGLSTFAGDSAFISGNVVSPLNPDTLVYLGTVDSLGNIIGSFQKPVPGFGESYSVCFYVKTDLLRYERIIEGIYVNEVLLTAFQEPSSWSAPFREFKVFRDSLGAVIDPIQDDNWRKVTFPLLYTGIAPDSLASYSDPASPLEPVDIYSTWSTFTRPFALAWNGINGYEWTLEALKNSTFYLRVEERDQGLRVWGVFLGGTELVHLEEIAPSYWAFVFQIDENGNIIQGEDNRLVIIEIGGGE